jgi:hypothetical protein
MMVLLYTGKRRGDAIKMRRDQKSDGMIEVVTSKTGSRVYIPIMLSWPASYQLLCQ